jgi:hypothetical protein
MQTVAARFMSGDQQGLRVLRVDLTSTSWPVTGHRNGVTEDGNAV